MTTDNKTFSAWEELQRIRNEKKQAVPSPLLPSQPLQPAPKPTKPFSAMEELERIRSEGKTGVVEQPTLPQNIINLYREGLPKIEYGKFSDITIQDNQGFDTQAELAPDYNIYREDKKIGEARQDLSVWLDNKQVGFIRPQLETIQAEVRPDNTVWFGSKQVGTLKDDRFELSPDAPEEFEPVDIAQMLGTPTINDSLTALSSIDELFAKPFAAAVTAPFRKGLELPPATGFEAAGVMTPVERGILSLLPGGPERERYEEWDAPWGVKGALELVPWLAMGGGAGKSQMQRLFGKVNKIEAKQAAGKVLNEAEKKVLLKAAEVETSISQTLKGGLVDIQDANTVIEIASKPDVARSIANLPGFKQIQQRFNPSAVANTATEKAMIARSVLRAQGSQRTALTMSSLWSKGNQETIFGKLDKSGLIASGELKGLSVNDIRTYPERYTKKLTQVQKDWVKKASDIEKAKLQYFKDNGINIKELGFEEGGEYAGRKVYGIRGADKELIDTVFVGAGPGRIGAKVAAEKTRVFKTAKEAIDKGYSYIPDDEALMFNVQAAYNRVADKRAAEWLLGQVKWRTTGAPEELKLAAESAKFRYDRSKQLLAALNRAIRGERVPEATINSIGRAYPDEAQQLRQVISVIQGGKKPSIIPKVTREIFTAPYQKAATDGETIFINTEAKFQTIKEIDKFFVDYKGTIVARDLERARKIIFNTREGVIAHEQGHVFSSSRELRQTPFMVHLSQAVRKIWVAEETAVIAKKPIGRPPLLSSGLKKGENLSVASEEIPQQYALYKMNPELQKKYFPEIYQLFNDNKTLVREFNLPVKNISPTKIAPIISEVTQPTVKSLRVKAKELINQDKIESLTAISQRARAREKALQLGYGETMVSQPAFSGKIFIGEDAKEIAATIHKTMDARASHALTQVNKINAVARYFKLAGDVSPMAIQLLFLAGENPKVYGKAGVGFAHALFDTQFHASYLAKNAQVITRNPDLLLTEMGTEFTEAMARGGLLRIKPFSWAGKALTPFQRGFEVSLDVAGIELTKSLEHLAKTPFARAELAAFVNEFRGLASSARLGVSPQMRAIETAAILAPRYNRAIAALMFDAARGALTLGQGGLRSRLAVRGLARGVTALSAMSIAVSMAMGEEYEDIVDHFDPLSSRFFTWNIGGTNIGPGSKVRSVVKLVAQSWDNPEALLQSGMDNPALRFVRGNLSPVVGSAVDILKGRNYVGDPVRDNAFQFGKEVIVSNLLPIWVESVLYEGGSLSERAIRGAGEFFGGRAYPETSSDIVNRQRNKYSQQDYGVDYEDIDNQKQRDELNRVHPDLAKLVEDASGEWAEKGSKIEKWIYTEKIKINESRTDAWNKTAQAFVDGKIDNSYYIKDIARIRQAYSTGTDVRWSAKESLDEYSVKQVEKWLEENESPKDKALSEFFDVQGQLIEQSDLPIDWDYLNAYLDEFVQQRYPEDIQKYINDNKDDWVNDLPELPRKVEKMRRVDMEYVSSTGFNDLPTVTEQREQGLKGKQVIDYRGILREQDPQLDAALNFWYDYYASVKTQEAMNILTQKASDLGRSYENIPAMQEKTQQQPSSAKDILARYK